jgi:hypothetical protein
MTEPGAQKLTERTDPDGKLPKNVTYTDAEILGELLQPDPVRHDEGDHVALGGIPVYAAVLHHGARLQLRFNLTGDKQ